MSGYSDIQKMRRLEKDANELGFMFANPKNGFYHSQFGDSVSLIPKDKDSVPVYARDAEVFIGTLEDLNMWLRGVEWARQYDMLLKVSDDEKRKRKEQDIRNKQLVSLLREEKLELKK